jgi:hypothetical protein
MRKSTNERAEVVLWQVLAVICRMLKSCRCCTPKVDYSVLHFERPGNHQCGADLENKVRIRPVRGMKTNFVMYPVRLVTGAIGICLVPVKVFCFPFQRQKEVCKEHIKVVHQKLLLVPRDVNLERRGSSKVMLHDIFGYLFPVL